MHASAHHCFTKILLTRYNRNSYEHTYLKHTTKEDKMHNKYEYSIPGLETLCMEAMLRSE